MSPARVKGLSALYIHQIVLRDVRGFNMNIPFWNEWTQQPLDSTLLTGPNGSGKTTVLRVVAALWESFGEWLRLGKTITPAAQRDTLKGAGLAAIELRGLAERPLWLFAVSQKRYLDELDSLMGSDDYRIGEERIGVGRPRLISLGSQWLSGWNQRREEAQAGVQKKSLPNMVFLEAETRLITPPLKGKPDIYPEAFYQWLVTYEARDRWEGHIEAMLRNLKVRNPGNFRDTLSDINQFLVGKRLTDFDDTLRLFVRVDGSRQTHYIDDLSAGERQCLIIMFMVSRWLQKGGIVLIDEPDLHLHVSLQRHFIHELEEVVRSKEGQLVVTSHSPTLWDEYSERQRIELVEKVQHG